VTIDNGHHGTHRGYVIGCREQCCTAAHTRYMKLYRLGRSHRLIDPTGTVRRINGLYALGWTAAQIGERCGRGREWARHVRRSPMISTRTAGLIAAAYDALSMTIPAGPYAERGRREAAAKGYLPPLAWDDDTIDDPAARPHRAPGHTSKYDVDPVAVARTVAGDRMRLTRAERFAVVAEMRAAGWSLHRIEEHTGIGKPERYVRHTGLEEAS
jgi:hypothetical protein